MKRSETTRRIVGTGGIELAVREVGGTGQPIVLIHGLGDSQRTWDFVIRQLGGTYRLVSYDLRGHGRSSAGGPYDVDTLVRDLSSVIDALDLQRPLLVGHSLGGLLAVEYAAAQSCAGVMGVEGGLAVERPAIAWDGVAARMASPLNRLISGALSVVGLRSRLALADIRRLVEDAEAHEGRLADAYGRTGCPMLVALGGRADRVPGGETLRTAIRHAAEHLWDAHPEIEIAWFDCGHMIPVQRPRELAELIRRVAPGWSRVAPGGR